jgi:2',3'-cyclic-nucleotide 2'-phosphodiesterase (5'-nucleotidase family)
MGAHISRTSWTWALCLVLSLVAQFAAAGQAAAAQAATLIYSGNLDGELEPCGCTAEGDLGGVRRRATMIQRLRGKNPDLFLVSAGGLLSGFAANGRLTNEYILKGFAVIAYDAVGLQWDDLQYGAAFLGTSSLPWVASNWLDQHFTHERRVRHGALTAAFFTWLDPRTAPQQGMQGDHNQVNDDAAALAKLIARAKRDGTLTVVTTTLSLKDARHLLPMRDIDVLLLHANYENYGKPQLLGKTLVLQPGSRGMRLGRVDLELDAHGRIATWHHQVIPLPKSVPDDPRLQSWYAEYTAHIKENYAQMVALRKAQASGETPYAGDERCQYCHRDAYAIWSKSRHANAFSALEDVNKSFDPNCLQCHTVGFNKPGGFIDMEVTASLTNVQCESCHGAAREHVKSGGTKPVANVGWRPVEMCAQCHTQPHSPSFNFDKYWPHIAH